MSAKSRRMEFKNSGDMTRFILLYKDLFVPYSEATIVQEDYVADHVYHTEGKQITTRGHHDENVAAMMRQGYRIFNNNMMKVNMEAKDFDEIKGMFRKERIRPGQNKWVLA